MKVLMIHEVKDWMLKLDLSEYDILTFDDGLFSQYRHYKHFLKFGKPMYFFISTKIICNEPRQQPLCAISSADAHSEYFAYDTKRYFMTWDQIKEINNTTNCFIGGHSHTHPRLKDDCIAIQYNRAMDEALMMLGEFHKHNIQIDSFCYPYNEEIIGYKKELTVHGVDKFFGKERIRIEDLK